ncbi:MAG: redox-sensing transcriptional repressor Rex [Gemmataceae bacterium]
MSRSSEPTRAIPRACVGRLSLYLRRLETLQSEGVVHVRSQALGESLGLTDTQVRKDLAVLGERLGHPGVGYDVSELIGAIRTTLGLDRVWYAALIGVGNLARALLRYQGFRQRGFEVVCLFDADPNKVGERIDQLVIYPMSELAYRRSQTQAELAILTVPGEAAQATAEHLIQAGFRGILNFSPGVIRVPMGISLVNVDLTIQLEQLAFLVHGSIIEK